MFKRFALLLAIVSSACPAVRLHAVGLLNGPVATARAIHNMPPQEAARRYPVHLRAVLTFYHAYIDPRRGAIFVCDASGCVLFRCHPAPFSPFVPETS